MTEIVRNPKDVIACLALAFGIAWLSWQSSLPFLHLDAMPAAQRVDAVCLMEFGAARHSRPDVETGDLRVQPDTSRKADWPHQTRFRVCYLLQSGSSLE